MRTPQFIHWSEGQFLQPHHFQQMQKSFLQAIDNERAFYTPYKEGLCNLVLDKDALRARRVVVKELSAIMPDGLALSMPGNTSIMPLTLELDTKADSKSVLVYLAVPLYTPDESNLADPKNPSSGRYLLQEHSVVDENTGDNEYAVITRKINSRLITDPNIAKDCTILPIVKLTWVSLDNKEPILSIDEEYTPPYAVLEQHSNIFSMVYELVFELKSCKNKILSDIDNEGFDPSLISGAGTLKLMQLQILNQYINTLSNYLLPDRVTPFTLYLQLSNLLASLKAIFPLSDTSEIVPYDHYNLYYVFKELLTSIRSLISARGTASCIELCFEEDPTLSLLSTKLTDEQISKGKEYYLALQSGDNNWKELIADIESGDNFRLMDQNSAQSRVRGVKLSYVRFPPRYLPLQGSDTVYFKLMREDSARVWRYIVEDHQMVIDYAQSMFKKFNAKLYISVVNEE